MSVKTDLYVWLISKAPIVSEVAVYATKPAIFTGNNPPEDSDRPYIFLADPLSDDYELDTKDTETREVLQTLLCVVDNDGSSEGSEALWKVVRDMLHRALDVLIDGTAAIIVKVSGPVSVPTDDRVIAVELTVRVVYNK